MMPTMTCIGGPHHLYLFDSLTEQSSRHHRFAADERAGLCGSAAGLEAELKKADRVGQWLTTER